MNKLEILQDNALTTARYEMTETEKNLFYMVVSQVKREDPPTKMYQVSVKEMALLMGSEELKFEAYRKATERLNARIFKATLSNGNYFHGSFIASAEYKKGTGTIEIELSQKVRPFYIDLSERFTKIQLAAAISLNSAYAKRIYELLCMYKNMKDKTFRRNVTELKTMLGIIDEKTGKDTYPDWTKFKNNVLEIAAKEINGHTDLTFTYEPQYGSKQGRGRKPVVEIEFEVFHQTQKASVQVNTLRERLISQFRLRSDQADEVLAVHSAEVINKQLYDIQVKTAEGKIKNIGSYTAKVFNLGKEHN